MTAFELGKVGVGGTGIGLFRQRNCASGESGGEGERKRGGFATVTRISSDKGVLGKLHETFSDFCSLPSETQCFVLSEKVRA